MEVTCTIVFSLVQIERFFTFVKVVIFSFQSSTEKSAWTKIEVEFYFPGESAEYLFLRIFLTVVSQRIALAPIQQAA